MATIYLNLNKQNASDGLKEFQSELESFGQTSRRVTSESERFNAEQNETIRTVAMERKTIVETSAASVDATAKSAKSIAEAAIVYQTYQMRANATSVALQGFRLAQSGLTYAVPIATKAIQSQATSILGLDKIAKIAFKSVTGLGPEIVAVTLAATAYAKLLDATGKRTDEFGQKTSNLDRVWNSVASLTGDVASNIQAGSIALAQQVINATGVKQAWKEIDVITTRGADNFLESMGAVRGIAEYLDLVAASTKKIDDYARRTADDFERLRQITTKFGNSDDLKEKSEAAKKYAEQVANIGFRATESGQVEANATEKTLKAAIDRLDTTIRAETNAAAEKARLNKFTQTDSENLERNLTALREARSERIEQLEKLEADVRKKRVESYLKQQSEAQAVLNAEDYERHKKIWDAEEKDKKSRQTAAQLEIEIERDRNQQIVANVVQRLELEGASRETIHLAKLKQITLESRYKMEDAKTDEDRFRISRDYRLKIQREEYEFQRANQRAILEEQKQRAAESVEIEKARQEKIKQLSQRITQSTGVTGEQLLGQVDQRSVLRQLQESRRAAAQSAAAEEIVSKPDFAFVKQDEAAMRRAEQRVRAAGTRAAARATADFRNGRVDNEELSDAQLKAGQEQLAALQKSGKLSTSTVEALTQMMQAAAENQAATQILQQQVNNLLNQSRQLSDQSSQIRQRAQRNSL